MVGPDTDALNIGVQTPSIDLDKSMTSNADEDASGTVSLNDTLTYTYTVGNDGTVTLTNVSVVDTPLGTVTLSDTAGNGVSTMAPGDIETGTVTYVVTQTDVDAGSIYNTATADSDESEPATDDETVTIAQNPLIDIGKTGTPEWSGSAQAGDTISYSFSVTNIGNVILTNISITDPLVTVSGGPIVSLAPGQSDSTTFTASYTLIQADIDVGKVDNLATASGKDLNDQDVTDTDGETVTFIQDPDVSSEWTVGWETHPIDKAHVLLPWIVLLAAIIAGVSFLVLRRRRAQS